jgi:hypothetical protein
VHNRPLPPTEGPAFTRLSEEARITMAYAVLPEISRPPASFPKLQPAPQFSLDLRIRLPLDGAAAEHRLVTSIEATVFAVPGHRDTLETAGRIEARILRFDDPAAVPPFRSALPDAVEEVRAEVFAADNRLRPALTEGLGIRSRRVFVIDRVELGARFHGRSLGHAAVLRLINLFGQDGAAVLLMPFPLQFDDASWTPQEAALEAARMGVPRLTQQEALGKLRTHWSRMGFRRLGTGDYYALNPEFLRPAFLV